MSRSVRVSPIASTRTRAARPRLDQPARQLDPLPHAGCRSESSRNTALKRPELARARPADDLVVVELGQLAREARGSWRSR